MTFSRDKSKRFYSSASKNKSFFEDFFLHSFQSRRAARCYPSLCYPPFILWAVMCLKKQLFAQSSQGIGQRSMATPRPLAMPMSLAARVSAAAAGASTTTTTTTTRNVCCASSSSRARGAGVSAAAPPRRRPAVATPTRAAFVTAAVSDGAGEQPLGVLVENALLAAFPPRRGCGAVSLAPSTIPLLAPKSHPPR
jgi:hypothetical protein